MVSIGQRELCRQRSERPLLLKAVVEFIPDQVLSVSLGLHQYK